MKAVDYSYSSYRVIGFSRVKIEEILRNNYSFFKKCPVLNENDVRVGSVTLKIEISDDYLDGELKSCCEVSIKTIQFLSSFQQLCF